MPIGSDDSSAPQLNVWARANPSVNPGGGGVILTDDLAGFMPLGYVSDGIASTDDAPSVTVPADEQDEVRLVREFLTGVKNITKTRYSYAYPQALITLAGGWNFLYSLNDYKEIYFLSLDIPISRVTFKRAGDIRQRVMAVAKEVGATVLPVADNAFGKASRGGKGKLSVVQLNDAFEAVFTINDRYYLSGYDAQESPPLYFLCRLPGPVRSVAEAREALKPASVKAAEVAGVRVERQGDIFAIESGLTDKDLDEMGAEVFGPLPGPYWPLRHWPPLSQVPIYGTAHTSYNIAKLPGHLMLAKGSLVHAPNMLQFSGEFSRRPDHVNRELGDGTTWWWLARNTVPIESPTETATTAAARIGTLTGMLQNIMGTIQGLNFNLSDFPSLLSGIF